MEPRLSLITLGYVDLARARAFYERIGFPVSKASVDDVVFFRTGGCVVALYPWDKLAADAGVPDGWRPSAGEAAAFGGITLAHNVRERHEVAVVLAEAAAAGGRVVKPAQDVFWGGHHGYFADPDGHLWEVAWNPGFPIDAEGRVVLP